MRAVAVGDAVEFANAVEEVLTPALKYCGGWPCRTYKSDFALFPEFFNAPLMA